MTIALLPLLLMVVIFVVGLAAFFVARGTAGARARQTTEPTCGRCGYIVRGLEAFVCPECGGDLREVGIIPPGGHRPLSRRARLLIWAVVLVLPSLVVGSILAQFLAPFDLISTRGRTLFIQSPTVNETIRVEQAGHRRLLGRPRNYTTANVPMQSMTLDLRRGKASNIMTVALPGGAAHFTDAAGKRVDGTFDAVFVTAWLNANGVTDATVRERARDVVAAVAEMNNPPGRGGTGFTRFSPNPQRGNLPDVTAHPAPPPFVRPEPRHLASVAPLVFGAAVWLIAMAIVAAAAGRARRPA